MEFKIQRGQYPNILVFVLMCSIFYGTMSSNDKINANESLCEPGFLVSEGKRFKFGFFSPVNSSFRYVGVMYNDLPVTTIVWVANREKPLNDSTGTIEISKDGNLVVLNGQKEVVWSSNHSTYAPNTTAMILNTGNLVLRDNFNGNLIWESFLHATDSLLDTMKLFTDSNTNQKNILTSWRSPSDPSPGRFTLSIVPTEFPQIYIWKDGNPFWCSGPWNGLIFIGLDTKRSTYKSGSYIATDTTGKVSYSHSRYDKSAVVYIVLNSSGGTQQKYWSYEKGDWEITFSSMESQCNIYGRCGPYGSCNPRDRHICTCFPGFKPKNEIEWSSGNWSGGCRRKTPLQCEKNSSIVNPGKSDRFLKLNGVKLPDSFKWSPSLEAECPGQCWNNCSCIAYAYYSGIGCMMWDAGLIDVQKILNGGSDLYIKLAGSDLVFVGNKNGRNAAIAIAVVLGIAAILAFTYFLRFRGQKRKTKLIWSTTGDSEESALTHNMVGFKLDELLLFDFDLISNATNKFDSTNKLGQGGFGSVYKGVLPNGQEIAVKRLTISSNQGRDEFMNEVEVISKLQHRNLVKLLGCCLKSEEKLVVYEYMSNKSLDAHLFDSHKRRFLDWRTRTVIIEGICRGLIYLHRDSRLKIIHRDLKASNILLDEELNPKISDFGTARIFGYEDDQANTTRVVGTFGYMPPEYVLRGIFSEKSDVYSFGVLLLEIVSGRRNSRFYKEEEQIFLTAYAWKLWNENEFSKLIDPVICGDPQTESEIVRYANVGLLCVQEAAADRPSTSTVLSMLRCEIVDLPRPKKPAFVEPQSPLSDATQHSHDSLGNRSVNSVTITIVKGR